MHSIRLLDGQDDIARYDAWVRSQYSGSLWQSRDWRDYQSALGRQTKIYVAEDAGAIVAGALIVIDRTTGGYSTWECPRGPLSTGERREVSDEPLEELVNTIIADAKRDKCVALYLSPPVALPPTIRDDARWKQSPRHEQPQATIVLDLRLSDEELLGQMHPKGRYNIKVAQRHGVEIRQSVDTDAFYELMRATAKRDGFTIGTKRRYSAFLSEVGHAVLLMAYHADTPIAGLLGVCWGTTGIYYYGASSSEHRHLMAPYLLQWQAIQHCKAQGCTRYDLLGVDPPGKVSAWIGVTEFKRKLGGQIIEYPAETMMVLKPLVYRGLQMKRKILG